MFACYRQDLAERRTDDAVPEEHGLTSYSRDLVEGVVEHRSEIDELISKHARDWSLERIAPLERCILRVALYEIIYRDDVPLEVAIDEAVELSKRYCGIEAPGFVNGILGSATEEVTKKEG